MNYLSTFCSISAINSMLVVFGFGRVWAGSLAPWIQNLTDKFRVFTGKTFPSPLNEWPNFFLEIVYVRRLVVCTCRLVYIYIYSWWNLRSNQWITPWKTNSWTLKMMKRDGFLFVCTSLFSGLYWIPGATWSIQGKDIFWCQMKPLEKSPAIGEPPRFQGTDVYTPPKANMSPEK